MPRKIPIGGTFFDAKESKNQDIKEKPIAKDMTTRALILIPSTITPDPTWNWNSWIRGNDVKRAAIITIVLVFIMEMNLK